MSTVLSFEQEWTRMRPGRIQIIRFIREAIGVKETQWSDLTKVNLINVAKYIKGRVAGNSARTYFAEICAFLHCYDEEDFLPCKHPEEVLKAKRQPQQSIYLTEEEIGRIEAYYNKLWNTPKHKEEKDVLTIFLIESFTGARISDCIRFTGNNLVDGKLTYTSVKTSVLTEVPEHRKLSTLIKRIPKRVYSETTVNRTLKRVAKKVGITEPVTIFTRGQQRTLPKYEFVTSHVGRKSFCTNLARRGVDIFTISAFAGHTNTTQTDHYIIRDTIETPQAALSFFR